MIYSGTLQKNKMGPAERRAYYVWMAQRDRCNRPANPHFKNYGAKAIKVEYGSREFIAWYLKSLESFSGLHPDVSRKDHSKNYSFDNIYLDEHSNNVAERNLRIGNPCPSKTVLAFDRESMKVIGEFANTRHAAAAMGTNQNSVVRCCAGINKGTKNGLTFKYKEL